MAELQDKELAGLFGVIVETGTTALTGLDVALIQCVTATTFATLTETTATGDAQTAIAVPAGTILRGKFTAITLTSGYIRAHKSGPLT